ncbi:LOW QUALITY PROTEIN: olfactory receptor 10C1-like [Thomomys bottae]
MSLNCSLWPENSLSVKRFSFSRFSQAAEPRVLLFTVILLMFLASLTGNALIAFAIRTSAALHTPMYFFLANLSLLEIGYTCSVLPKMLQSLVSEARAISREGCATQMFFFTLFGITECCLLAAMAFDRYVAICSPLHYATRMSRGLCVHLAMVSWGVGCVVGLGQTNYIFSLDFCGPCEIDHFFCDLPPLLALACGDTSHNEVAVFVVAVLCISSPFVLILASYARILAAVLLTPSPEGRHKALSTCSSHLLVVTLFYGSGSLTYLRPKASHSPGSDKLLALFYTAVTSTLNPIIYSLRNKDVKAALRRTGQREVLTHGQKPRAMQRCTLEKYSTKERKKEETVHFHL